MTGSLKPAAPPLAADAGQVARLRGLLAGRRVWVAASTHPADEAAVLPAQARLAADDASWLLILAPRLPQRGDEIAAALRAQGLSFARRSAKEEPGPATAVWLADSFGELGLWYRLAGRAYVGGAAGDTGGHNPWEAVTLGLSVLHGPNTANFAADYRQLEAAGLARSVPPDPGALAAAVAAPADHAARQAEALVSAARAALAPLAARLLSLRKGVA